MNPINPQNNPAPYPGQSSGSFPLPPVAPTANKAKGFPMTYSAGGGLVVGVIIGLLLISGDSAPADASQPEVVAVENEALEDVAEPTLPEEAEAVAAAEPELADPESAEAEAEDLEGTEGGLAAAPQLPSLAKGAALVEPGAEPIADPEPVIAELSFSISPEELEGLVTIEVNGEDIDGARIFSVDLGDKAKKRVRVSAKAKGYRNFSQVLQLEGNASVDIVMKKRPAGSGKSKKSGGAASLISL